jgi:hypothetical protein
MSDDLEKQLREALRHVDPAPGFAARVSARTHSEQRRPWLPQRYRWMTATLAASVLLTLMVAYGWELRREQRQGLAARQQLIEALRLTGEKLDLAYRGVQDASKDTAPGNRGDT